MLCLPAATLLAQNAKSFTVKSPDGTVSLAVQAGAKLTWPVNYNGVITVAPSAISLTLQSGEVIGDHAKII